MACEEPVKFGTSLDGMTLEGQLNQMALRQELLQQGPGNWAVHVQMLDALSVQFWHQRETTRRLVHAMCQAGVPIPLLDTAEPAPPRQEW